MRDKEKSIVHYNPHVGSRRRCSVHLINNGVIVRSDRKVSIEWGLSGPTDVQSGIPFTCSLEYGREFQCKNLMLELRRYVAS